MCSTDNHHVFHLSISSKYFIKDSGLKFDLNSNSSHYGLEIMVGAGNKANVVSLIKHTLKIFIIALLANIYLSKYNNGNTRKIMFKVHNKVTRTTSMT